MIWLPDFSATHTGRSQTSRRLVRDLAERPQPGELAAGFGDIGALALKIIGDRAPEIRVGDVMRGVGGVRQISACELVLALRAGFDDLQPVLDRKIDRLIVADLEMQERMVLDRTPIAAEQRIRADEIDGARDPSAVALGHDQENVLAHALADQRKELPREIGPSPFARAGFHVEAEEGVPGVLGDVVTGQPVNADVGRDRLAALSLDRLAMARIETAEKIVEGRKTLVVPVKLLVGPLQEAVLAQKFPLGLARECHMRR